MASRRYGPKAQQKVARAMHERKRGTLKSSSGKTVTSRKQAIAIGLSEARREGGKTPPAPRKTTGRGSGTGKSSAGRKQSTTRRKARPPSSRRKSSR